MFPLKLSHSLSVSLSLSGPVYLVASACLSFSLSLPLPHLFGKRKIYSTYISTYIDTHTHTHTHTHSRSQINKSCRQQTTSWLKPRNKRNKKIIIFLLCPKVPTGPLLPSISTNISAFQNRWPLQRLLFSDLTPLS